ncbi:glycogen synthase GlgA [Pseudomonas tolaasii]|uniref:Glycogen synthase n=2 Tax=Pseudomonas tolaasii TaxID=29442 RepID=A0A7Y8DML1_PSETO|nr:glycogen synthase GlgA [Pseudomonas tolaasii]ARB30586.1 starch synthase [Pseudomonas tolaasii]KAB0468861.1 glycogen synthase GlgA [Pseudomonas tolaasii]MBW1249275.1 glycogen synthase GlgA [Pseudomonas tolaasii]MBW4794436.1 glycogen synthase GlgA [Pseudomonas tolaasii]MBY8941898.1 glycogen synthase GlgA [Pseudomonas tolaasii]
MISAAVDTQGERFSQPAGGPTSLADLPNTVRPIVSQNPNRKKVLFVTSEFADLVKTGGLGDVSAALPRAMAHLHDVRVLIPGYPQVMESDNPIHIIGELGGHAALPPCKIGRMDLKDGLVIYVLICPELYEREGTPYGANNGRDWPDNHIRFARLGLAAADMAANLAQIHWCPDLVHAHDWPAGLAPAYMHWRGSRTPTLFTIHNLAYQGVVSLASTPELGIPPHALQQEGMEFYGKMSFLKAGMAYSSHITTVSATYAQEITTPEFGCGLDGFLASKTQQGLLSGIPNGIDESWETSTDTHLTHNFNIGDWEGKAINADHVRELFGLHPSTGPLFAVVSRLVYQKGLDLTEAVAGFIVENGGQIAIIGRGEPEEEQAMRELALRFPGQVSVRIGFNEADARRMFAGSDFLLMPSRYEPCGLSQMYAQRFGSLPVARNTGGLADTIENGVTGFLFNESTVESYEEALSRAFRVFANPGLLNAMRSRAMTQPFNWCQAVEPYAELYEQLVAKALGKSAK